MAMASRSSLLLLLLYYFFFFSTISMLVSSRSASPSDVPAASPPSTGSSGAGGENSTEFIRARCGATRYPGLCFTSLAGYSSAIQKSPVQLACVAANLTHTRLAALAARVAALRRACPQGSAASREAAALRDCSDAVGDAEDQTARTVAELRGLDTAVGPEVAWRVSNAQTWLSAALTNEDTCTDGFGGVAAGSLTKAEVGRRVRRVKQYTSNALALVNSLVAS